MPHLRTLAAHWTARRRGASDPVPDLRMSVVRRRGERRTQQQLCEHYLVERELADRLRRATRSERQALYSKVYDELFRRVPHHPMLVQAGQASRQRDVSRQLQFLRRFLTRGSVFLEIGAGDCALAMRTASFVKHVYAIDVSEQITRGVAPPGNFQLILSDGCTIPVPEGSVDVAFSDQLMEHLHPEDAEEQLRNIYRSLAPGGIYLCITPNRVYGPCDISVYCDEVATGFHLREYTSREIRQLFADAGFAQLHFYARVRGRFLRCPPWAIAALESTLGALPHPLRRLIADIAPMRSLLELRVAAVKQEALQ